MRNKLKDPGRLERSKINHQLKNPEDSGSTKIVRVPNSYFRPNNAVMIAGFPSPGLIGSIACNHLIEQLALHQIAYIHSKYITPGVIWVGGKLRHPFRIYSNKDSSVCLLICDVPVVVEGIDSISAVITEWCHENNVNKTVIVSGIFPDNMNPFPKDFTKRKAFVIENESNKKDKSLVNDSPGFAFIGGLAGQVLANSVLRSMQCAAALVPTFSFIPDPEGAALVLEAIGNLIPNAKVSSSELRQEAEKIKSQLLQFGQLQHRLMKDNPSETPASDETEQIYK
jgi:uncharacterized protein